jgi:hypothetical protein
LCTKELQLIDKNEKMAMLALKNGWFLNETLMIPLSNIFASAESFDGKMECILEREWDHHWEVIIKALPDRAALLMEAKKCHDTGLYGAAIHLFYSQADGVFADKFNYKLLYGSKFDVGKNELSHGLDSLLDTDSLRIMIDTMTDGTFLKRYINRIYLSIMESAKVKTDFVLKQNKSEERLNIPSRHGVLHGVHKNYSSKTNSLKCFSFFLFILFVIHGDKLHETHVALD